LFSYLACSGWSAAIPFLPQFEPDVNSQGLMLKPVQASEWMRRPWRAFLVLFVSGLFLISSSCAPRKTKHVVDRVYELDPSGKLFIHPQFLYNQPTMIAVLPFRNLAGEARVMGSKKAFLDLNRKRITSAGMMAQEMRYAFFGQLAQLPFELMHPRDLDARLKAQGVAPQDAIEALSPQEIGDLTGVDAVVFGEVINLDYFYALLYTQIAAGLKVEMVSTRTGETLWRFNDTRRAHTVRIALDPVSLAVGLFQAGFSLRSINLTRAMDEICREAVATIPPPP
jgi:hypothetical protein